MNVNLKSIRIFKARFLPPVNDDRQTWMLFNSGHIVIELWSVKKQQTTNKLSAEDQLACAENSQRLYEMMGFTGQVKAKGPEEA